MRRTGTPDWKPRWHGQTHVVNNKKENNEIWGKKISCTTLNCDRMNIESSWPATEPVKIINGIILVADSSITPTTTHNPQPTTHNPQSNYCMGVMLVYRVILVLPPQSPTPHNPWPTTHNPQLITSRWAVYIFSDNSLKNERIFMEKGSKCSEFLDLLGELLLET